MSKQKQFFKTNIKCANCIGNVTPVLDEVLGQGSWHIDTIVPEKKLTVESDLATEDIIKAVEKAGYKASVLG